MPFLLLPVVQELLGITLSTFKVTDKSGGARRRSTDWRAMLPFLVLLALSAFAVVRVITLVRVDQHAVGLAVLLFWLFRNAYYLVMALFLIDGRDRDDEPVRVIGAELVQVEVPLADGVTKRFDGVATTLTEHSIRAYLDDAGDLKLGTRVEVSLDTGLYHVEMDGIVVELRRSRHGTTVVHTIEILDEREYHDEYLQILYDRVPSLPQVLGNDHGSLVHLWRNIALHVARGVES
jgi:cellulose synthase (UDP-forming)